MPTWNVNCELNNPYSYVGLFTMYLHLNFVMIYKCVFLSRWAGKLLSGQCKITVKNVYEHCILDFFRFISFHWIIVEKFHFFQLIYLSCPVRVRKSNQHQLPSQLQVLTYSRFLFKTISSWFNVQPVLIPDSQQLTVYNMAWILIVWKIIVSRCYSILNILLCESL